jgi:hypothetical protein
MHCIHATPLSEPCEDCEVNVLNALDERMAEAARLRAVREREFHRSQPSYQDAED